MRWVCAVFVVVACSGDPPPAPEPTSSPPARVRVLTDRQFANAIHDLLGDVPPFDVQTPSSLPHQFLHDDVVAVDAALLSQYRVAAEETGRFVATRPFPCTNDDTACARGEVERFATRAFRRPLEPGELDELSAIFAAGGWGAVVETVLQAPSFLYRSELSGELTAYELATAVAFLLLDSIPDEPLWTAAINGTLTDPAVLAREVDRLLATERVRAHLDEVVLEWLEIHRVLVPAADDAELRASMFAETQTFVHDVLWNRGGSLRELLTSRDSFVDRRLADHYGYHGSGRITHPPVRAGVLTQASVLTMLSTDKRESIIKRGIYVHRHLLCTAELGRPPFSAIAEVAGFTYKLSESQFAYYRLANPYCAGCHHTIDPPGRALEGFDRLGLARAVDDNDVRVESDAVLAIDGTHVPVGNAVELAHALASSEQVSRCVVDQFTHHAFGTVLDDDATRAYLYERFAETGDLVDIVRAIATSPAFRTRRLP